MSMRDIALLLNDASLTRTQRLTRLQGWRGAEAVCADSAAVAQRIGPAVCAAGAAMGAVLSSPAVLAAFAATAMVGAHASNHRFEAVYNRWQRRRGGTALPPNRAAKRLGCVIGAALLGGSAVAYGVGAATVGFVLAVVLGGTAAFVAATGICIPSMVFTLVWGAERAAARDLFGATSRTTLTRR